MINTAKRIQHPLPWFKWLESTTHCTVFFKMYCSIQVDCCIYITALSDTSYLWKPPYWFLFNTVKKPKMGQFCRKNMNISLMWNPLIFFTLPKPFFLRSTLVKPKSILWGFYYENYWNKIVYQEWSENSLLYLTQMRNKIVYQKWSKNILLYLPQVKFPGCTCVTNFPSSHSG